MDKIASSIQYNYPGTTNLTKQHTMNNLGIDGTWAEQKLKLKEKFASLLDNDLKFNTGEKNEMFRKLQIKLGKTKEELQSIISKL